MGAEKHLCGIMHGFGVHQTLLHPPDAMAIECRLRAAVDDAVEIISPDRRKAGVKTFIHLPGFEDGDCLSGLAQHGVHGLAKLELRPTPLDIGVADLAGGMDAGIGAAGHMERHRLKREAKDCRLDRGLHGMPVGLTLPALVGRAVIFDGQLVAGHQRIVSPLETRFPSRNSRAS